ncbi:MAG: hypothetical protein ACYSSO_02190 [Planctomycetota bacterium]
MCKKLTVNPIVAAFLPDVKEKTGIKHHFMQKILAFRQKIYTMVLNFNRRSR